MAANRPGRRYAIRSAKRADVEQMAALDARLTGVPKRDYWEGLFAVRGPRDRNTFLLVATGPGNELLGFIVGEVRAWEFGSLPAGWIFAIEVDPACRLDGIGTALFDAVCERFRAAGVAKVRTVMARDQHLIMSFFRSQGMMAGPFTELEMDLDP